jgi:hypothetical protein
MVLLTAHAVKAEDNSPIDIPVSCPDIAGRYLYFGASERDKESISFNNWLSRPSVSGVQWIKITNTDKMGKFKIFFMNHLGQPIYSALDLNASCVDRQWEEKIESEASSDGALVRGTRIWRYYRDEHGVLVVALRGTTASKYFPGFPWSNPRAFQGVAKFLPHKNE